jgi:hypothetical protein
LLLLVLLGMLVLRDAALTGRLDDLEARAGALEAFARRQRGQIAELQAGTPAGGQPAETVALVIEMAGEDFPQIIVRAGLDTERERRVVLLLPSQDRQRLEAMRTEWPTLTAEEKERYVGVLTAAVEESVRRELPALFIARRDIEEALFSALDGRPGPPDAAYGRLGPASGPPAGPVGQGPQQ